MSGQSMTGIHAFGSSSASPSCSAERCLYLSILSALNIHHDLKVLNVHVPQLFKDVIDALNLDVSATSTVWVVAGSLILGCAWPHLLTDPISLLLRRRRTDRSDRIR